MSKLPIYLIAAVGQRGQLGLDGQLPWHDSADLAWFKNMTRDCHIVFGARTLEAAPHLNTLPARYVHRDEPNKDPLSCYHAWTGGSASSTLWIGGGARTYHRWMPFVHRCYVSKIDYDGLADSWMPMLWGMPPGPVARRPLRDQMGATISGSLNMGSRAFTIAMTPKQESCILCGATGSCACPYP